MDNNQKRVTWSKGMLLISGSIFIVVIGFTLFMYISNLIMNVYDTAALGICVSVSGAIFGSNLVWYSKKAASENHYKLRMALFDDAAKVRLDYNEKMMQLMTQYHLTESDIMKIDESGDMDKMMNDSIDSVVEGLNEDRNDCDSRNEIENFGG